LAQGPYFWSSPGRRPADWRAAPPAETPVAGVSWYEAAAYARWARKRLPSEAEWGRAALVLGERARGLAAEPAEWCADRVAGEPEIADRLLLGGREREVAEPVRRALTGIRCARELSARQ
jgi:hypothetical protein